MSAHIHFTHGNGFPSESYQEYFDALAPEFDVSYLPMSGHQVDFPVTDNWDFLVKELLHDIKQNHHEPVYGVGHSMGGVLMFMAACEAPELFKSILLLDSPIPGRWRLHVLQILKRLRIVNRIMPIDRARTRRNQFKNHDEAFQYFRTKSLFKNFTEASLQNYVQAGLVPDKNDGFILRFDRNIEEAIYASAPHNLHRFYKKLQVPAYLLYSQNSDIITAHDRKAMVKYYGFKEYCFPKGGHLFPFEFPQETAAMTKKILLGVDHE